MILHNKITSKWIEAYINKPYVTCIIEHNNDINGAHHAIELIVDNLNIPKSSVYYPINKDNTSIKIEEVREIRNTLSLRAGNSSTVTRLIVIEQANTLTIEAQNALLKLLEELPSNTAILLLTNNKDSLLSTIVSRSFSIPILPIGLIEALEYAKKYNIQEEEARKYYVMSDGKFTFYNELVKGVTSQEVTTIQKAKDYYNSTVVRRMQMNEEIVSDKETQLLFMDSLELIAKSGMRYAKNSPDKIHWKNNLKIVNETKSQLKANVSAKLLMLKLSVNLH